MNDIAELLAIAVRHHRDGRLQSAEKLYRQILAAAPDHADALNFLGAICHQTGRLNDAAACWRRLAELKPDFATAHYNLGLAYKDLGKLDDAAACWRRTIELQPNEPAAHNNLGNVLRELGKLDEATACYRRALELQPGVARPHYNLANALRDQDKLDEAAASYRRALELTPDYVEALINLGNLLRHQGNLDQAIACWRRVVELQPDFAEAHFNLGTAYTDQENFAAALACCRRAVLLKPDFAAAHSTLGNALRELGALDEAAASCRRAIALNPGLADAHNNLGNALKDRGELDEAVACYRRAIELRPDFTKAHVNLGAVEELLGDFQQAESCFRAVLEHDNRFAPAHYNLAKLLRGKLPDDDLAVQRRLLAEGALPDSQRMLLHFGLAQALDARGDYAAAAENLQVANALQSARWRSRGLEFDPKAHERLVARIIELCTPEFFARVEGFGLDSELPVFVVGLPRSGTTLIEQILAAHSKVFAAGEIKLVPETLAGFAGPDGDFLAGLAQPDSATAGRLAARHLERLRAFSGTALRIVDKLPDNYLYLGPLAVLFPRARFIHCRRDLRDVALSCWTTHFQEICWANDEEHIAAQFREYQRIMDHWRKVLPGRLLELDYEQVVGDLEGSARRLIGWCGLEWEPNCLKFHEAKRPVSTASAFQVRQPIYKTSVQKWRHYKHPLASLFARIAVLKTGSLDRGGK